MAWKDDTSAIAESKRVKERIIGTYGWLRDEGNLDKYDGERCTTITQAGENAGSIAEQTHTIWCPMDYPVIGVTLTDKTRESSEMSGWDVVMSLAEVAFTEAPGNKKITATLALKFTYFI